MRDKLYYILKDVIDHDNVGSFKKLASRYSPAYVDFAISGRLLTFEYDEDGAPTDVIHVDRAGYQYIVEHDTEVRRFWRSFFSQFITGLITGSVGALVIERIILVLLSGML